jgi:MerR family mercuric resistance operon transcriptional regulator
LGFTLGEIRELLNLRVQPGTTPADVRERAEQKLAEIRRKVADLQAIGHALGKLTAACSGEGPLDEYLILHHLEGELAP